MPMIQYPFIDIAVHEKVRPHFAGGEAVVLFSPDMEHVLWANGRGASLFGYSSVYDFLDQGPLVQAVSLRQIRAAGRNLKAAGDATNLTIRVASGFRRVTVTGSCSLTEIYGELVVLFHAPPGLAPLSVADRARSMIEGLEDADTHLAVVDGEGGIAASSPGFASLSLTPQTARMLVTMSGAEASRLVKRPVPTAKGYLPAAMAKVSSDPALHLLFVVEAAAPGMDQAPAGDDAELVAGAPVEADDPQAPDDHPFEDVIDAVADLEEPLESTEAVEFDLPQMEANEAEAPFQTEVPLDPAPEPDPASASTTRPAAEPDDGVGSATDEPVREVPALETADEGFVFRRDARATRFVWKIDADGRFCEISEEFAKTVGPNAADINGMVFSDVASRFHLDPEGKIAELLSRRDTWSGKTIWWPVEGTSLAVPIDLAALPTYTRARTFDGFRGFGIIRVGDVIEHAHAVGLSLGAARSTEPPPAQAPDEAQSFSEAAAERAEAARPADQRPVESAQAVQAETSTVPPTDAEAANDVAYGEPTDAAEDAEMNSPQDDPVASAPADLADTAEDSAPKWPKGERPALRLVDNQIGASNKVVPLDHRRSRRENLSPVEQAAFREIARQLESFVGRQDQEAVIEDTASETSELDTIDEKVDTEAGEHAGVLQTLTQDLVPDEALVESSDEPAIETEPADIDGDSVLSEAANAVDEQSEEPAPEQPLELQEPEAALALYRERDGLSADVLDQMPVALLVHAGDRLIHGNPEFLRLSGYSSIEALAEVGGLDALLQRQDLEGKTVDAGGMVVVRADDVIVPVTARLQSIRFDQASALMLALMPVAAEKVASPDAGEDNVVSLPTSLPPENNARLQVEVDELRAILETATDGVVVIESDGTIRSMNGAASALFNYDSVEAAGKPFVMLFAHESQRAIVDYLGGISGHGVASVLNDGREVIGREASGGFIPLFMTIGRLTSSNGYCAVIRDITQWKRTEEELRSAKRSAETANAHKSEFLAHVSHEIRTPLNAIIGFADLMATEHFGPVGHPRYVEYANDIVRSGRHVLDIVNDLLDISKIEAGEMELDFVAVDLNASVSEGVSLVQPQANSQRVIIRTALSHTVPPVVADHRSVKQIVLNILSNAIRFTPSGGQIVVSTVYEANGCVVLRVRDTGVGMTRQELETAMKPFRQVAGGTRKRGEGTGLGLPLTKAMVDANRANFSIQSTPREGTLVEISFPPQRVLAN